MKNNESLKRVVTKQLQENSNEEVSVNVTNAPDEEDLTSVDGLLKFKDRAYGDGMGYVILRKDKTIAEQIVNDNTIYEIRYIFDLNGTTLTMPTDCILKFNGGSLRNGFILPNKTKVDNPSNSTIFYNLKAGEGDRWRKGFVGEGNLLWFNVYKAADENEDDDDNKDDCAEEFQNCLNAFRCVYIPDGIYSISKPIYIWEGSKIYGSSNTYYNNKTIIRPTNSYQVGIPYSEQSPMIVTFNYTQIASMDNWSGGMSIENIMISGQSKNGNKIRCCVGIDKPNVFFIRNTLFAHGGDYYVEIYDRAYLLDFIDIIFGGNANIKSHVRFTKHHDYSEGEAFSPVCNFRNCVTDASKYSTFVTFDKPVNNPLVNILNCSFEDTYTIVDMIVPAFNYLSGRVNVMNSWLLKTTPNNIPNIPDSIPFIVRRIGEVVKGQGDEKLPNLTYPTISVTNCIGQYNGTVAQIYDVKTVKDTVNQTEETVTDITDINIPEFEANLNKRQFDYEIVGKKLRFPDFAYGFPINDGNNLIPVLRDENHDFVMQQNSKRYDSFGKELINNSVNSVINEIPANYNNIQSNYGKIVYETKTNTLNYFTNSGWRTINSHGINSLNPNLFSIFVKGDNYNESIPDYNKRFYVLKDGFTGGNILYTYMASVEKIIALKIDVVFKESATDKRLIWFYNENNTRKTITITNSGIYTLPVKIFTGDITGLSGVNVESVLVEQLQ